MSAERLDYYEILQVAPHAVSDVIKAAYRALTKTMHPDAGGSTDLGVALNEAAETLLDPVKRSRYDMSLRIGKAKTFAGTQLALTGTAEVIYVMCLSCGSKNQVESEAAIDTATCDGCKKRYSPEPASKPAAQSWRASAPNPSSGLKESNKAQGLVATWSDEPNEAGTVCGHPATAWVKRMSLKGDDAERLGIPEWSDAKICSKCWRRLVDRGL